MALNRTCIQGRLTRDVELRTTGTGVPVTSGTIAWSEKHGETETKLFLPFVAWRGTAEMLARWFSKGQELLLEGKLTTRAWTDKTGQKREVVELVVDSVHFCGNKLTDRPTASPAYEEPEEQYAVIEDTDETLPF